MYTTTKICTERSVLMFKDYNMNQLILPLDLAVKLQENDIAFSIHQLIESIPHGAFNAFVRHTGCPA